MVKSLNFKLILDSGKMKFKVVHTTKILEGYNIIIAVVALMEMKYLVNHAFFVMLNDVLDVLCNLDLIAILVVYY